MKTYKQLTQFQRYTISAMSKAGFKRRMIAKEAGVAESTISRELKRNSKEKGHYCPKAAHAKAIKRRKEALKYTKMTPEITSFVAEQLQELWSPEQISGHLKRIWGETVCHETIYQFILKDKRSGGRLYKYLRHLGQKRKKRFLDGKFKGSIKDRISIEERPAIVDQKVRLGDWEIDTIIGKKDRQEVLISAVERVSKLTLLGKSSVKNASSVAQIITDMLLPVREYVKTITFDNGTEFADHKKISKELGASIYFTHPYSAWERGLNENTNGLIRQYFPKGTSFEFITEQKLNHVIRMLNSRPRKTLKFLTPTEVFWNHINQQGIALIV